MRLIPHGRRVNVAWLTIAAAAVIVLSAVWNSRDDIYVLRESSVALVLLVFMAAITLGEIARLSILGRRETAPLSTAAALALAMTSMVPTGSNVVRLSVVVLATAVAMGAGILVHALRRQQIGLPEIAARVIGLSVASVLYRKVHFGGHDTARVGGEVGRPAVAGGA